MHDRTAANRETIQPTRVHPSTKVAGPAPLPAVDRLRPAARRRARRTPWSYARWVVLALVLIFFLFPIYWMLITSFKGISLWTRYPPLFYPDAIHFENYADALFHWGGLKGLEDSAIVCTATTILSMLIGVPAGYSIARFRIGGRNYAFWILSILFLPPVAVVVPLFNLWSGNDFPWLNLIDTYQVLIIQYTVFNVPFVVWVMKGFFEDVPQELEDSALVNGTTRLRALWDVVLPMVRPGLGTTALFVFIFSWSEFLFALILTRRNVTPLPFVLPTLMEGHSIKWGDIAAIASIAACPLVLIAFLLQRYLVAGFSFGAIRQRSS
jgi:multiple sugar transport system permease protein